MPLQIEIVQPRTALPVFARLYGCSEQDFETTSQQMTTAWIVQDSDRNALGAIGVRPSPAHGAEVMGGAFIGLKQHEAARELIQIAVATHPELYAYAEAHLLPAEALEAAGLHQVSAYTRMNGSIPKSLPTVPDGFKIVPLSQVSKPKDLLTAQRTYSDRIGHTHVPVDAAQPGFGGSNDTLGRLAYDVSGVPAGICRAWPNGQRVALGTPGICSDARGTGLRRALLLSVCQAALEAGATNLELDAWGDTDAERSEDQSLGLVIKEFTPIYSSVLTSVEPSSRDIAAIDAPPVS